MKSGGGSVGKYNRATRKLACGQWQYSPHVPFQEPNARHEEDREL